MNVLPQPVAQEEEHVDGEPRPISSEAILEVDHLGHEIRVGLLVRAGLGITKSEKIPLFRLEMGFRVVDQPREDRTQDVPAFPPQHGGVQVVDQTNELLMLCVDLGHIDAETLIPLDHPHGFPPRSGPQKGTGTVAPTHLSSGNVNDATEPVPFCLAESGAD